MDQDRAPTGSSFIARKSPGWHRPAWTADETRSGQKSPNQPRIYVLAAFLSFIGLLMVLTGAVLPWRMTASDGAVLSSKHTYIWSFAVPVLAALVCFIMHTILTNRRYSPSLSVVSMAIVGLVSLTHVTILNLPTNRFLDDEYSPIHLGFYMLIQPFHEAIPEGTVPWPLWVGTAAIIPWLIAAVLIWFADCQSTVDVSESSRATRTVGTVRDTLIIAVWVLICLSWVLPWQNLHGDEDAPLSSHTYAVYIAFPMMLAVLCLMIFRSAPAVSSGVWWSSICLFMWTTILCLFFTALLPIPDFGDADYQSPIRWASVTKWNTETTRSSLVPWNVAPGFVACWILGVALVLSWLSLRSRLFVRVPPEEQERIAELQTNPRLRFAVLFLVGVIAIALLASLFLPWLPLGHARGVRTSPGFDEEIAPRAFILLNFCLPVLLALVCLFRYMWIPGTRRAWRSWAIGLLVFPTLIYEFMLKRPLLFPDFGNTMPKSRFVWRSLPSLHSVERPLTLIPWSLSVSFVSINVAIGAIVIIFWLDSGGRMGPDEKRDLRFGPRDSADARADRGELFASGPPLRKA